MNSIYQDDNGNWRAEAGSSIDSAIREAILIAPEGERLSLEFNGVTVQVRQDSNPDLIYRDWSRALSGYIDGPVGPYPALSLTAEEEQHDAEVEAENEARREQQRQDYRDSQEKKRREAELALQSDAGFQSSDEEGWKEFVAINSGDGYSAACVSYAERWARLMQVGMAEGATLEDCAEDASRLADLEGITGFMYGCAVMTLAKYWKHGDQLRRWHNLRTQCGDEGEQANETGATLNPALLSIRSKE